VNSGRLRVVFVVHGTRRFLDRVGGPTVGSVDPSTSALGDWYATVLFWKPQLALFVKETTLLPVLVPFAPAITVLDRFPAALATVLKAHDLNLSFIDHEVAAMTERRLAGTSNRSVVGIMTEFTRLGEAYRSRDGARDLVALSLRLGQTPCGPLYRRHVSPDRELAAFVAQHPR
jgi:hypothetical protein